MKSKFSKWWDQFRKSSVGTTIIFLNLFFIIPLTLVYIFTTLFKPDTKLTTVPTRDTVSLPYKSTQNPTIYGIKGDEIVVREGPGKEFNKIVNQKATDILGTVEYIHVDNTCKVQVLETKDGWSKINVIEPDWLRESHIGWIKSEYVLDPNNIPVDPLQGKTLQDWKSIKVPTYMNDKQEVYDYLIAMTKEQNYLDEMEKNPKFTKKVKLQKQLFTQKLKRDFPKLRKSWTDMMHRTGWEHEMSFYVSGGRNKDCNVTGYMFASNQMIKVFYEPLSESFRLLRFNKVKFRWYEDADQWTYFNCGGESDGARLDNYGLTNY